MATLPPGYKPREGLLPSVAKPTARPTFGGKPPVGPTLVGTLKADMGAWWDTWGSRLTGLVVVIIYSATLIWLGFSLGYNVPNADCIKEPVVAEPYAEYANMPIELAKEHPEAAKFLVKADKNGFQCNFEMALHKLKVHHLTVTQAKGRMDNTPPNDKGRYGKFKDKFAKASMDERGYHECVAELMPDVMSTFQKDIASGRMPDEKQVAEDEKALGAVMKFTQDSGRSVSDDERFADALHKTVLKGRAFDPFPDLKRPGKEQYKAYRGSGEQYTNTDAQNK